MNVAICVLTVIRFFDMTVLIIHSYCRLNLHLFSNERMRKKKKYSRFSGSATFHDEEECLENKQMCL